MTDTQRFLPKNKWLDAAGTLIISEGSKVKWTIGKSRYRGTVTNITPTSVFVRLHPHGVTIMTERPTGS